MLASWAPSATMVRTRSERDTFAVDVYATTPVRRARLLGGREHLEAGCSTAVITSYEAGCVRKVAQGVRPAPAGRDAVQSRACPFIVHGARRWTTQSAFYRATHRCRHRVGVNRRRRHLQTQDRRFALSIASDGRLTCSTLETVGSLALNQSVYD
ncbi:hypothetical protein GCM10020220_077480 [Nonomuraea rubra]